MTRAVRHSWHITLRYLRAFIRQPAWVVISLVQPVIWLLIFGGLFKKVVEIPGFDASGSYIVFLTPGVIVMTAISSAGWNGMAFIDDMHRGVMDRFLVSPVWRGALNVGSMAYGVVTIVVQALVIVGLAYATGAHFRNGAAGIAVLVIVAALLGASFAALSNALALVVRKRESLIGAVTLVMLPLTFMSAAFMQLSLAPTWIQDVAKGNPVNWGVQASRSAATQTTDWSLVGSRIGFLVALLVVSTMLATRAFRAYQRSV